MGLSSQNLLKIRLFKILIYKALGRTVIAYLIKGVVITINV